ncbi:MAG: hypothetical protein VYC34_02800, partial [Planctomycetota bacterium]|nr:hypothetical protein [Planctomycetota bacterium]
FLRLDHRAYVVANVLLKEGLPDNFYDLFLLGDGELPSLKGGPDPARWHHAIDVIDATWTVGGKSDRAVLTMYWPMPFDGSRFQIIVPDALQNLGSQFVPLLADTLALVNLDLSHVEQVRLTRWGHALPIAAPNFIASGDAERAHAPIDDKVFFVQQDNWALPAVENTLLDAYAFAPLAAIGL